MSKHPLRVAIIGTAKRSDYLYGPLIKALPEDVELVSVWGRSSNLVERLGKSLGVPAYTDLDKLLGETAPEIGVVSVSYHANGEVGLMAVEAGLHVLLETPIAHKLSEAVLTTGARAKEDETARRMFVLQYVQPGLAGLMDGSVSTLAPLFAAAFATHNTWETFLVGMAASVGAGISMGFAEALSDDGSLTGRGAPLIRGAVCGVMTAIGGVGHTLPFLIPDFYVATVAAILVVAVELAAISWIRTRFMDTPFLQAAFQVVVGGVLVFIAGILIGSS